MGWSQITDIYYKRLIFSQPLGASYLNISDITRQSLNLTQRFLSHFYWVSIPTSTVCLWQM